jgi:hypothetical protein
VPHPTNAAEPPPAMVATDLAAAAKLETLHRGRATLQPPWKSGASAPRKALKSAGLQPLSRRNIPERHTSAKLDELGRGQGEKYNGGERKKNGQTFSAGLSFCRRRSRFRASGRALSPPAAQHPKQSYKPANSHLPERPCCGGAEAAAAEYTIPLWAQPTWEGIRQPAPQLTSIYSSLKFPVTEL